MYWWNFFALWMYFALFSIHLCIYILFAGSIYSRFDEEQETFNFMPYRSLVGL